MSNRISLDPNILPMIFDTCPPILTIRTPDRQPLGMEKVLEEGNNVFSAK